MKCPRLLVDRAIHCEIENSTSKLLNPQLGESGLHYGKFFLQLRPSGRGCIFLEIEARASRRSPQPAMGREIPSENAGGGQVARSCDICAEETGQCFESAAFIVCVSRSG
jgi:hypothetical protein